MAAAKSGDATARAWLAQYLVGKPATAAPAPLTVVVQQLSGQDPLVSELAQPYIDREKYPPLYEDEDLKQTLKARVARELRALEAAHPEPPDSGTSLDETTRSEESSDC